MDVADKDFTSFFRLMDQQRERHRAIAEVFRTEPLPLAALAQASGKSLFEIWSSIIESESLKLTVTVGDQSRLMRELEAIKTSRALAIDLSGLLSLRLLGLLSKLPRAFSRLKMTRPAQETLGEWQAEFAADVSFSTVWEDLNSYGLQRQLTNDELAARREFLADLRAFVEQSCEVLPATKVLTFTIEQLAEYEAFGSGFTSALLADEQGVPLFLDDFYLGQIGHDLGWIGKDLIIISIQSILLKFKFMGLISQVEYWAALKRLIGANYRHIFVDAEALWWMCRSEGKAVTPALRKILESSFAPPCNEEIAIIIGARVLYHVCFEVLNQDDKLQLIDLILNVLQAGREPTVVFDKLKSMLSRLFRYSPKVRTLIEERIHQLN